MKEVPIQVSDTVPSSQAYLEASSKLASIVYSGEGDWTLRGQRRRAEIQAVRRALEHTGWNRKKAAALLAISYRGLLYKIQRNNITRANGDAIELAKQAESPSQNGRVG